MADVKSKLVIDVNKNPSKKGIKVQFVLPETLEGDAKAAATQKIQSKLNKGLELLLTFIGFIFQNDTIDLFCFFILFSFINQILCRFFH